MAARRGFSMIELLIAMAIGAFGIAIAARMVRTAVRSTGRGNQQTEMQSNARLLGAQFRADLELAGLGSTGAIAVSDNPPWTPGWAQQTSGAGFRAIPAVHGGNAISGDFGGSTVLDQSDAIQLVVPDPATLVNTERNSPQGGQQLFAPPRAPMCNLVYISDHSAPNGAGRTQLALVDVAASTGSQIQLQDQLQFPVAENSDVMCARISTYWVSADKWLHRTDFRPGVAIAPIGGSSLRTSPPTNDDLILYGVEDLQVAYRFSSEIAGRGAGVDDRWAFDRENPSGAMDITANATGIGPWFEVRQVRWTLLMRTARAVDDRSAANNTVRETTDLLEDRTAPLPIDRAYARHYLRTSALLVNLRFFDQNAPRGLAAEPY